MRESLNAWPEAALTRILNALEQELLAASDEDILAAARDLGMNPAMKGSAAFWGVSTMKYAWPDWWLNGFDEALLARLGMRRAEPAATDPVPDLGGPRRDRRMAEKKGKSDE
jgi:hypothetical protein